MTDVFLSYAREDRERVRAISAALQNLSWDVWWDPSEPQPELVAQDTKLNSAGCVIVVWSHASRFSDFVRSEAATGLYRNKLIQVSIDPVTPPRPFEQGEIIDISGWSGDRDDPNWVKLLAAIRLYAGAPGSQRPQATRKTSGQPAYIERRTVAIGPLAAVLLLVGAGAVVWFGDPFGWRKPKAGAGVTQAVVMSAVTPRIAPAPDPVSLPIVDSPEAERAWAKIDRTSPAALRGYLIQYPQSSEADGARSMLRVLDAQAWVAAVNDDNDAAYSTYLKNFPADAAFAGAMAQAAKDRLVSLGQERDQAVAMIQKGLADIKAYPGPVDGKIGDGTVSAVRQFAQSHKRSMINLKTAAPRDLRAFADVIAGEAAKQKPVVAAAATAPAAPAPTPASVTSAAAAADKLRQQQAQAAAAAAKKADADALAAQQLRKADDAAWTKASGAGTAQAYQDYLRDYPQGAHASEARNGPVKVAATTAAPFSTDSLTPELRNAVAQARQAQQAAQARASSARQAAERADAAALLAREGGDGTTQQTESDGGRYEGQAINGGENGVGVRVSGGGAASGDRYRGEVRNGQGAGVGVYEFADNANNASAGALRYEGEHAADRAAGLGVTTWRNGDVFAGQDPASSNAGRGVMSFANGLRYEGEMRNGARNGYGVVWSAKGDLVMAGRWRDGDLVEPAPGTPTP